MSVGIARRFTCQCTKYLFINKYSIIYKFTSTLEIKRNYAVRQRFYGKTGILFHEGKYEITLDQRKLKTPNGKLFIVESEPLALAVAEEWNAQKKNIQLASMHLTTLCNTVLDNPTNTTKYDMVQYITNLLHSDTVLFQSGEDDTLYDLQVKEWDPVIQWFCDRFNANLSKSRGICSTTINEQTKMTISRHLMSYNQAAVYGYMYGVDTLKSVILVLACAERFISLERATYLARLEEEFQLALWGRVEWAHDLNQHEVESRLAASIFFVHCNSSYWFTKQKGLNQS